MKNIHTIEKWKELEQLLLKKGYELFQTQYDITYEEEYQVRFINKEGKRYEIKTYNEKVKKETNNYNYNP